jgi:MFS transporter, DHA2 family, multidrug resistance protein
LKLADKNVMSATAAHAKATRREWIGLGMIALPCLVYAMDLTVLNLALPVISQALKPSNSQLLWMVDIYGFFVAGFLITMGTLGDRIGRRKLLLIGCAAFGVASSVAAFSNSIEMLIAMRALLGIAGATLAPSTLSLIRNMFRHDEERQFAIGVWIASFSLGGAIGPLVGGALLQFFGWGAVFLVAVPVMLAVLLFGPTLLPEYKDSKAGHLDLASVVLSLGAVLSVVFGFKHMAEHGLGWLSVLCLLAGCTSGVAFVRRQGHLAHPLMDMKLFQIPHFSAAIMAYSLSCLVLFGVYIFITQYLQLVLGFAPFKAGLATVPWAVAFVVGSLLAPRLKRYAPNTVILVGGLVVAAFAFLLLTLVSGQYGLQALIAGTVIMSLGLAPVFTLCNDMIMSAAPPERAGAASAISETSSEFSGALGIAVFGSVGTVLYRADLAASAPVGLPADRLVEALGTLGGAIAAAAKLPGGAGDALLLSARTAFVDAMQIAAIVAALILLATSVALAHILREHELANRP